MTLLSALRATKVLGLAVVLLAGGMTAADARDGWRAHHHDRHGHHTRLKRLPDFEPRAHGERFGVELHRDRDDRRFSRQGRDFYSGALTAYRFHGNGIYFYRDAVDWNGRPKKHRGGGQKVIAVTPGSSGCSWEAGVCVIRPGW